MKYYNNPKCNKAITSHALWSGRKIFIRVGWWRTWLHFWRWSTLCGISTRCFDVDGEPHPPKAMPSNGADEPVLLLFCEWHLIISTLILGQDPSACIARFIGRLGHFIRVMLHSYILENCNRPEKQKNSELWIIQFAEAQSFSTLNQPKKIPSAVDLLYNGTTNKI